MNRFRLYLLLSVLCLGWPIVASAQVSHPPIRQGTSDPATCDPSSGSPYLKLFYRSDLSAWRYCSGVNTWSTIGTSTGCTVAGASGDVQYNSGAGACAAEAALNYNAATNTLTVDNITATAGTVNAGTLQQAGIAAVTVSDTQTLTSKTLTTPVLGPFTVAGLPAAGTANRIAIVTDGNGASCTSGGSTTVVLCRDTGSAWAPLGDGAGTGSPGGTSGQVQWNSTGAFAGVAGSSVVGSTVTLDVLNLTTPLGGGFGGTGNAFFSVTGPATSLKTYTFPNASTAVLTTNAAVTVAQGGTGLATLTANRILVGAGAASPNFIAEGIAGQCLLSNGAGADPSMGTCPNSWSTQTNPTGNLSLSMAANTTSLTWGALTGAGVNMLSLADSASNTGTGYVLSVNTETSSAAKPVRFTAGGVANGVEMTTAGVLQALGTGGVTATGLASNAIAGATAFATGLCANDQIIKKTAGTWQCDADSTSGALAWSAIGNPAANLTLSMGTFSSTFNSGTFTSGITAWNRTGTWNSGATTFVFADTNITNTASASGSILERWRVGGTAVLEILTDRVRSPLFESTGTAAGGAIWGEAAASGTDTITLAAPSSVTASYTLTFPSALSSGGFWRADSGGALTFVGETGTGNVVRAAAPVLSGVVTVGQQIEYTESAGDPACAAGNFWVSANSTTNIFRKCQNGTVSDLDTGGAGGDSISVNGVSATDADFDDATPAAPANGQNVKWQRDAGAPNNLSAYVDPTLFATVTWGNGAAITWTFDAGAVDPVIAFTSGNIKYSGATTYTFEGGATDPVWTPGNGAMNLSTGTLQQGGTAVVLESRTVSTTAPLAGGGALSGNLTLSCNASSDTAAGCVELATVAETTTGTDAARAVTPDALAGSDYGKRYITTECIADATALTTGDGKCYFAIHPDLDGWLVVGWSAHVGAAVSSSGVVTVAVDRCGAVATGIRCSGVNVDIFSTLITIDANEDGTETAAIAAVINTANDDLATGQWLRFNVDGAGTGTQGLYVTIVVQKP